MYDDVPLFQAAMKSVHLSMNWRYPDGWCVSGRGRREGGTWAEAESVEGASLDTNEAAFMLADWLYRLLGLE